MRRVVLVLNEKAKWRLNSFKWRIFRDGFFYRDVLNKDKGDLEELGSVR